MKRDRFERQDGFAGLIHRFNIFLKPARGADRAELAVEVYDNVYAVGVCYCNPANLPHIAPGAWPVVTCRPIAMLLSVVVKPKPVAADTYIVSA